MLNRLRSLLGALASRRDFEAGMSAELKFHMEQYAADLVRSGTPPVEARRRARMELGGLNSLKDDCRKARGLTLLDDLGRDLRHAVRTLRKSPGFTAAALLTLGLCLGANLTIFAVIDSILLRPLPFPDSGRLVTIFNTYPKAGVDRDGSSIANYYERRGRIPAFSSLSMYRFETAIVGEQGSMIREPVILVSPEFFATLGRGPAMGRVFAESETAFDTDSVVILSDGFWRQNFRADPQVVGRRIRVSGNPFTVVGVLPPGFHFLSSEARLYFPYPSRLEDRSSLQRHSGGNVTQIIARLRPGVALAQAQSQIDAQNAALEVQDPEAKMMADAGFRSIVTRLHADHVASIRPTLLLLQAGVLALLLIGAVNLVNLLLIRAAGRAKELAVRQALGAGWRHVVSEALVETVLLTLGGGLLGLAAGAGGIRLLAVLAGDRLPLGNYIAPDARLFVAALAASLLLGVLLAAPVAWFHLRPRLGNALRSESRTGTAGRAAQTLRHGFIVAQIALAFVLLSGSALLGLSLKRAMSVSPGFEPSHVLTSQITLPGRSYPDTRTRLAFVEKLMNSLGSQPGVVSVGVVSNVPFSGHNGKSAATVKGYTRPPGEPPRGHYSYSVGGDYFRAMGFSLIAGRFLGDDDSRRSLRVCVVDQDFARYYWPKGGAIGQQLFQGSQMGPGPEAFTVVGVVGNVKQAGLTDAVAQGAVYYPYSFRPESDMFVAIRSAAAPENLGRTLRSAVRQIDAELPVNDVRSMEARISDSLLVRRSPALLAGFFSVIALLLTAVGTYGVLSYAIAQRKREIGVRMALGARPDQIRAHFLTLALRLLAGGTVLGVLGAWFAGRALQALLFHVPAFSVAAVAAVAVVVSAVSLAACLLPAHRAARTSPMEAIADD